MLKLGLSILMLVILVIILILKSQKLDVEEHFAEHFALQASKDPCEAALQMLGLQVIARSMTGPSTIRYKRIGGRVMRVLVPPQVDEEDFIYFNNVPPEIALFRNLARASNVKINKENKDTLLPLTLTPYSVYLYLKEQQPTMESSFNDIVQIYKRRIDFVRGKYIIMQNVPDSLSEFVALFLGDPYATKYEDEDESMGLYGFINNQIQMNKVNHFFLVTSNKDFEKECIEHINEATRGYLDHRSYILTPRTAYKGISPCMRKKCPPSASSLFSQSSPSPAVESFISPSPAKEEEYEEDDTPQFSPSPSPSSGPPITGVSRGVTKKYPDAESVFAMFCMTKCKSIYQMTPYSPACILASMIGNIPITLTKQDMRSLAWKPCLKMWLFGDEFDHEIDLEELDKANKVVNVI